MLARCNLLIPGCFLLLFYFCNVTIAYTKLRAFLFHFYASFFEFPIPTDVAFIGEIGLGGELRTVCNEHISTLKLFSETRDDCVVMLEDFVRCFWFS